MTGIRDLDIINNLRKIYEAGKDKVLLISATGTGKTYASAFAMRAVSLKMDGNSQCESK